MQCAYGSCDCWLTEGSNYWPCSSEKTFSAGPPVMTAVIGSPPKWKMKWEGLKQLLSWNLLGYNNFSCQVPFWWEYKRPQLSWSIISSARMGARQFRIREPSTFLINCFISSHGTPALEIRMPSTILINYFISSHGSQAIQNTRALNFLDQLFHQLSWDPSTWNTNAFNYPDQLFHQLAWEPGNWEYERPQLSWSIVSSARMGTQQLRLPMPSTILINCFISSDGNRAIENTDALNYPHQLFHQLSWDLSTWNTNAFNYPDQLFHQLHLPLLGRWDYRHLPMGFPHKRPWWEDGIIGIFPGDSLLKGLFGKMRL